MKKFELIKKYVIYVIDEEGYLCENGRIFNSKEKPDYRENPVEFNHDYEAKDFIVNDHFGYWKFEIREIYCKVLVKDV